MRLLLAAVLNDRFCAGFLDAGNNEGTARSGSRRSKNAKARSRGKLGTGSAASAMRFDAGAAARIGRKQMGSVVLAAPLESKKALYQMIVAKWAEPAMSVTPARSIAASNAVISQLLRMARLNCSMVSDENWLEKVDGLLTGPERRLSSRITFTTVVNIVESTVRYFRGGIRQ
jgi:hypothetical protein